MFSLCIIASLMFLVQLLSIESIFLLLVMGIRSHITTMPYLILANKYVDTMMFWVVLSV